MEKIFEGAIFGDKFRTRDNRKAIYVGKRESLDVLIVEGEPYTTTFFSNGHYLAEDEMIICVSDITKKGWDD